MPIIQYFDPEQQLFFVLWQGVVDVQEWYSYAEKLIFHPAWSSTPRLLADLRFVHDTSTIGKEEIAQAAKIYSKAGEALFGKQVAVVARDEFGKARHLGDLLARFRVSWVVFNNIDTACLFLGLDPHYASKNLHALLEQLRKKGLTEND